MSAADKPDRLNWLDPDAVRAWVGDVARLSLDLITVAEDQTDPPGARMYGRRGARDMIDEASASLRAQIAFAQRGLPDDVPARCRAVLGDRTYCGMLLPCPEHPDKEPST